QSKIHTQIKNILFEKGWLLFLVGFLLGRAIILSAVSPFPVAFLATIWFIHKKKSFKVILAIIAGALTFSVIHTVFVVLGIIVFILLASLFKNVKKQQIIIPIIAF